MPRDVDGLPLQNVANATEKIECISGWAAEWAVKSDVECYRALQRLESGRHGCGERLKQLPTAVEMLVFDRQR